MRGSIIVLYSTWDSCRLWGSHIDTSVTKSSEIFLVFIMSVHFQNDFLHHTSQVQVLFTLSQTIPLEDVCKGTSLSEKKNKRACNATVTIILMSEVFSKKGSSDVLFPISWRLVVCFSKALVSQHVDFSVQQHPEDRSDMSAGNKVSMFKIFDSERLEVFTGCHHFTDKKIQVRV